MTQQASAPLIWFNPAFGVAGDMVIASLLDLGADLDVVVEQIRRLPVDGWSFTSERVTRRGLVATLVTVDHGDGHHHRPWSAIDAMLRDADLEPAVADGARRTFAALARAEADVHGVDVDEVHFHEVGAVDAIVDIVGSWAALWSLCGDEAVVASAPVGLGAGTAAMAHGNVPVPAPATLELLVGCPTVPVDTGRETATPTGAALLVTMAGRWGAPPPGTLRAVGRGAGRRDPDTHPNVLTALAIEPAPADPDGAPDTPDGAPDTIVIDAVLVETNVDDVTPERLGYVIERALHLGADDAWVTPIVMKKSRPAHQLSVLCPPGLVDTVRAMVAEETGTLGMRVTTASKHELPRRIDTVTIDGHRIRIKIGPHGAKPEHDDVVAVAAATGRPARMVADDALSAWRRAD